MKMGDALDLLNSKINKFVSISGLNTKSTNHFLTIFMLEPTTYAKLPREEVEEILTFNFDYWYTKLKHQKVKLDGKEYFVCNQTVCDIELSIKEMKCLQNAYEDNFFGKEPNLDDLKHLSKRINDQINNYPNVPFWFIRLSSRSPKDVLGGIRPCENASDVVQILIESNRVSNDLQWYLVYEIETPLYLHMIKWKSFQKENEVRCFVYQNKLVAITHYYLDKYFSLRKNEFEGVKKIDQVFNQIKDKIPYDDYVIDLEVGIQVNLVEFNAYGKKGTTGAVLFDWTKDESILLNESPKNVCVRYLKNDIVCEHFIDL